LQPSTTVVSAAEETQAKEGKSESRLHSSSKFDRKKFDALIGELLRTRYNDSDKQHTADSLSSTFLVVGWFSKGSMDPYERLIKVKDGDGRED